VAGVPHEWRGRERSPARMHGLAAAKRPPVAGTAAVRSWRVRTTRLAMVVVRVDNPGPRSDPLRHLVHVAGGRQPRPNVEELPHSRFPGQVLHSPAEERAVLPRGDPQAGRFLEHLLRKGTVRGETALPAEQVIVNPGRVRPRRIKARTCLLRHCRPRPIRAASGPDLDRFLPWNASPDDFRTWAQPPPSPG
jgi:hypothetical protein